MLKIQKLITEAKIVGKIDLPHDNTPEGQISKSDLKSLEKVLDALFKHAGIDIEFSKHMFDRVNDPRNKDQITIQELRSLFQKTYQKYKDKLNALGPDTQAVLNDLQTDVNVPFILKWDSKNNELDLVSKTVMRKKNFMTSNPKLKV